MTTRIFQSIAFSYALLLLVRGPLAAHAETNAESIDKQFRPSITEPTETNRTKNLSRFLENPSQTAKQSAFRVELGTRILYVSLLAATKGSPYNHSFIGSIYKLDAYQNYLPLRPYVQITKRIGPAELGLGLSYDQLKVATVDDGGGDGDIQMYNLMLYLLAAYPNKTRFTPFGEFGLAAYWNSFDPDPTWSQNGYRRFDLENSTSPYLAGGCDVAITGNFSANLYIRYVNVDVDGEYIYDSHNPEPFTFTLEHIAYGVGVKYAF